MFRKKLAFLFLLLGAGGYTSAIAADLPPKAPGDKRLGLAYDLNGRQKIKKDGKELDAFRFTFGYGQTSWVPATIPLEFFPSEFGRDARICEIPPPMIVLDGDDTPRPEMTRLVLKVAHRTGLGDKLTNVCDALIQVGKKRPVEALEKLVSREKLDKSTALVGGRTLAEILEDFASVCAKEKDAARKMRLQNVLAHLLIELADAGAINQGERNTCGIGSLQMALVLTNPAEYARIVTGLALGRYVWLVGGQIALKPWEEMLESAGKDARSAPSRLFQNAFVRLKIGQQLNMLQTLKSSDEFITTRDLVSLFQRATGLRAELRKNSVPPLTLLKLSRPTREAPIFLLYRIPKELNPGVSANHWVVVTGINAQGQVEMVDPQGIWMELSLESVRRQIVTVLAPHWR